MSAPFDDSVGAAPETRSVRFLWLLAAASAAPLFWLGQTMLGYGITTALCYPGDHPVAGAGASPWLAALFAFDAIALAACAIAALVSWRTWRWVKEGRNHFLALWGLLSSLWFFAAILFNIIASLVVRPCLF